MLLRLFILFLLLPLMACHSTRVNVDRGELDLRQLDMSVPRQLEGQWRYYPNWLMHSFPDSQTDPVSSRWQYVPTRLPESHGFGTYQLRVIGHDESLLMYMGQLSSSARIWVNGQLLSEQGQPHLLRQYYRPGNGHHLVPLQGSEWVIDVEVVNFDLHSMGIRLPVIIGDYESMQELIQYRWFVESALVAVLLFLALYHAIFYAFLRQRMPELLPFSVLSLMVFIHTSLHTDIVMATAMKDIHWFLDTKLRFLALVIGCVAMSRYLLHHVQPSSWMQRLLSFNSLFGIGFALVLLLLPFNALVLTLEYIQLYCLLTAAWLLAALILGKLQGIKVLWLSAPIFIISVVSDMLFYRGIINFGPIAGWGFGLLLMLQSIDIMQRLSRYWNQSQRLLSEQHALYQEQLLQSEQERLQLQQQTRLASTSLHQDSLTALANRSFFSAQLAGLLMHSNEQVSYYLLLIDIRYFRQFNIENGIAKGDCLLQTIAKELDNERREGEVLCRWGNGQFALLCPLATDEDMLARRLRLHNKLLQSEYVYLEYYFAQARWHKGDSAQQLMQQAEMALQAEKCRQ